MWANWRQTSVTFPFFPPFNHKHLIYIRKNTVIWTCDFIQTLKFIRHLLTPSLFFFPFFFFTSHRFTICHKTEVVKNTLDPVWQAFKIPVRALCNGDYDRWGVRSGAHSQDKHGNISRREGWVLQTVQLVGFGLFVYRHNFVGTSMCNYFLSAKQQHYEKTRSEADCSENTGTFN